MSFGSTLKKIGHQVGHAFKGYKKVALEGPANATEKLTSKGFKRIGGRKANAIRKSLGETGAGILAGSLGASAGFKAGRFGAGLGESGGTSSPKSTSNPSLPESGPSFPAAELAVLALALFLILRKR